MYKEGRGRGSQARVCIVINGQGVNKSAVNRTVKSLMNQTMQDFVYRVYFDGESDQFHETNIGIILKAGDVIAADALATLLEHDKWSVPQSIASPRFGVVIPAYNSSEYVGGAVRSSLAQSGVGAVAVVVVDDGSTDGTRKQARRYMQGTLWGQVLRQANAGVSAARNAGLVALPKSVEYVCFLDADDQLLPDALKVLETRLNEVPGAPMAAGLTLVCDQEGALKARPDWCPKELPATLHFDDFLTEWPLVTPGTQLWRCDKLRELGGFPATLTGRDGEDLRGEDVVVCAMAARQYGAVACVSVPVMIKREHPASFCGSDHARLMRAWAATQARVKELRS